MDATKCSSSRGLQDVILSWNYWEICCKLEKGEGPITSPLPTIPPQFTCIDEYVRTFEPLLIEESAAQLIRGQEEGLVLPPLQFKVASIESRVNRYFTATLVLAEEATAFELGASVSENDIILLSLEDPDSTQDSKHALALIESIDGPSALHLRLALDEKRHLGDEGGIQRIRFMLSALSDSKNIWWVKRLANLSTILREWSAIHSLPQGPIKDVIMTGHPTASVLKGLAQLEAPPRMRAVMEKVYNSSQMEAVTAGLDGSPMVLIQGPPGTGKTQTIMGLLSIILYSAPRGAFSSVVPSPTESVFPSEKVDANTETMVMTPSERRAAWLNGSPWLLGRTDPRSAVVSAEDADPNAAFGLLTKSCAWHIGKEDGPKARVLVCAPSNSALDEIVLRLISEGLLDKDGKRFTPNVVRVGLNIHHSVQSVALDTLVSRRLAGDNHIGSASHEAVSNLSHGEKERLRASILEEASIVCTTLSFSGSKAFTRLARKFDVVVVDEAAQAVEPAVLVPLTHGGAKQVFLVGDPVQLPATVMSQRALNQGYSESLFKRLQIAGYPVKVLDTQYRMHPTIRAFPSKNFYADALMDGPQVETETSRPWHSCPAFQPLVFLDTPGKETTPAGSSSIENKAEAQVVVSVYRELVHRYPTLKQRPGVAVISPYKAQVHLLRNIFKQALGPRRAKLVDINTIDGFQGREMEITIFSTVRSPRHKGGGIGFVADERRINVGLTRARTSLIVVGNAAALQRDSRWAAFVAHARNTNVMYRVRRPFVDSISKVAEGVALPEGGLSRKLVSKAGAPPMCDEAHFDPEDMDADLYSSGEEGYV